MKKLRLFTFALSLILIFGTILAIPVSANSLKYASEEDFPLEIEKSILTFDLTQTYDPSTVENLLATVGTVSTEYHLYNPTDSPVTVTLMCSLGEEINFNTRHDKNGVSLSRRILEKYSFTLNGKPIKATIRHSFYDNYSVIELRDNTCYSVSDTYQSFYNYAPDTPVTICTYTVTGLNEKEYPDAVVAMDIPKNGVQNGNADLYIPNHGPIKKTEEGLSRIFVGAGEGKSFTVCLIGSKSNELPEWHLYADDDLEDSERIEGQVTMTRSELVTFLDYALAKWTPESGISRVDWYNAFACQFYHYKNSNDYLIKDDLTNSLNRIYQYEITLGAGERAVHTVTTPIFPTINDKLTSTIYTYNCNLSASPKIANETEVFINTPLHLIQKDFSWFTVNYTIWSELSTRFEKTEQGYYLHLDALPDFSDLTFTLSKSEDPEVKPNAGLISFLIILIVGIFMQNVVLPIVLAIMIIVFLIKLPRIIRRSKEKRKAKQEEAQETESSEQPTDEDE